MTTSEQRARQLVADAEKKLSSSNRIFNYFFGNSSTLEDAADCYQQAAILYKVCKNWCQAGATFAEAADLRLKIGSRCEAATSFIDAANCYKKNSDKDCIKCFLKAINVYLDMGQFSIVAKLHNKIAEVYENGVCDVQQALQHYEQAATYFNCEDNTSSANRCLLKVAHYSVQLERYQQAIQIYEQVARSCLVNSLLKYSTKEYLFKALLCNLCLDPLNTENVLERYKQMEPTFDSTRECKLMQALLEHVEEHNAEGFANAVREFDSISRFDQWYNMILLRIKKQIEHFDIR